MDIPSIIKEAFNEEAFRNIGTAVVNELADYLSIMTDRKTIDFQHPDTAYAFWKNDIDKKESAVETLKTVLAQSVNVHHPNYIGHQVSAPAYLATLGGLISDMLNNGSGVYEMGMTENAMEKVVSELICEHLGYDHNAGGVFTSGGSLANLTALLAARKAKGPTNVWSNGHHEKLAILVSEESHYCIDRAARIMGLGAEGIIKIPSTANHKINTDLLEAYYAQTLEKGFTPMAVVGCACSTSTGSFDDLTVLADFAESHDLWFHVDGAHGGGTIFSEKYRHLVAGIERADSVTIDFHKMLLTPALNTILVYKDDKHAFRTFQQKAQYLWNADNPEWYHSGKRAFECTKFMMALKPYLLIKHYGTELFTAHVDYLYDLSKYFANRIKEHPAFELALEPECNIVNFRFIHEHSDKHNAINDAVWNALITDGQFYIVQTMIRGKRYLRTTIINPLTTTKTLDRLLHKIEQLAKDVRLYPNHASIYSVEYTE